MESQIEFYLENGPRRSFAGALEWPGWCRPGKTEESALEALVAYGPRYKRAIGTAGRGLDLPQKQSEYKLVERLEGNATTDFGAPGKAPSYDERPLEPDEVRRLVVLMKASWKTLDSAAEAATGKELKKGPRGGGRELDAIMSHVREAEKGYLASLGQKFPKEEDEDPESETARLRQAVLRSLKSRAAGEPPETTRAKALWSPRYFVRRAAWHVLDHAWEIEDRAL